MAAILRTLKLGCAAAAFIGTSAYAQSDLSDSGATKDSSATPNDVDAGVIVVTAEKRTENLMSTNVSASVLDNEQLRNRGLQDIRDLVKLTPGLTMTGGLKVANIRGVGLTVLGPTTSSGVTNYIDGQLIAHEPTLIYPYFDIAQFEVLRGPQGTVSGSNSTGGSILAVSVSPTFDGFYGIAEQRAENHNHFRTDAAVNLPVSDTFALRLAMVNDSTDGFWTQNNPNVASRPGSGTQFGARLGALFQPNDKFSALAHLEYGLNRGDGGASQPTQYSTATYNDPRTPHQPFNIYTNEETSSFNDVKRGNIKLTYHISDNIAVTSFTAESHFRSRGVGDGDSGPLPLSETVSTGGFYIDTFQQEFNILSTGDSRLGFLLGAYYLQDIVKNNLLIKVNGNAVATDNTHQVNHDKAVFGQVTFQLTPKLEIQLGGRYTRNERSQDTGSSPPTVTASFDWDVFTTKLALNYKASDTQFFYAFAAKGGKSGSYNFDSSAFGPETDWDYEVGWKGQFLNRKIQLQLNGYYIDYDGFQLSSYPNPIIPISEIFNTKGAHIKGIEGSLETYLNGIQLYGSFSYSDSEFKKQALVDTRYPANGPVDITGMRLPFSAEWQFNAGAAYDIPIGQQGSALTPRIQVSYLSGQWISPFHVPLRDYMPGRTLVDASLTLKSHDGWSLALYGQNIFDKRYINYISTSASTPNETFGDPATYGIRGTFRF